MTHPVAELVIVLGVVAVTAAAGTMFVMPRPKPDVPEDQKPAVVEVQPALVAPVVQAEPVDPQRQQLNEVRVRIQAVQQKAERLEKLLDDEAKGSKRDGR